MQIAASGDFDGIGQSLGNVREQLGHLRGTAENLLRGIAARTAGIRQNAAFLDADPRLVSVEFLRPEKRDVIGRDHGQVQPGRQRGRGMDVILLRRMTGTLKFDIEPLRKQFVVVTGQFLGQSRVAGQQGLANIAFLGT